MKKLMTSLMLCGVVLMAAPVSVKAADSQAALGSGQTDAEITFTKNDLTKIKPVNPNSPNETADPEPDMPGLIQKDVGVAFVYVTSNLQFGKGGGTLSMTTPKEYPASIQASKNTPVSVTDKTTGKASFDWTSKFVIEVADDRADEAGDWDVKVSGTPLVQKNSDGTVKESVNGAQIMWYADGHQITNSGKENSGKENNSATLTQDNITLNLEDSPNSGTLISAKKGSGAGITVAQFDPTNIKLKVPANTAKAGTYQTTLNWSLEKTPKA